MICEPVPTEPDTVSSSAVAAATATEAVRSAVAQVAGAAGGLRLKCTCLVFFLAKMF